MGEMILNLVIETLAQAGFTVREAFPGRTLGNISTPVAAVELEKVDGAQRRVTAAVHLYSPAAQGGTACARSAMDAARSLEAVGGRCAQSGCSYDGVVRVYQVTIRAEFLLGSREVIRGTGFQVWLDDAPLPWVTEFRSERIRKQEQREPPLETGEFTQGVPFWEFYLEELIPQDCAEPELPEGTFTLRVQCGELSEVYTGCSCGSILREFTREGLKQVCKGMCMTRAQRVNG